MFGAAGTPAAFGGAGAAVLQTLAAAGLRRVDAGRRAADVVGRREPHRRLPHGWRQCQLAHLPAQVAARRCCGRCAHREAVATSLIVVLINSVAGFVAHAGAVGGIDYGFAAFRGHVPGCVLGRSGVDEVGFVPPCAAGSPTSSSPSRSSSPGRPSSVLPRWDDAETRSRRRQAGGTVVASYAAGAGIRPMPVVVNTWSGCLRSGEVPAVRLPVGTRRGGAALLSKLLGRD